MVKKILQALSSGQHVIMVIARGVSLCAMCARSRTADVKEHIECKVKRSTFLNEYR